MIQTFGTDDGEFFPQSGSRLADYRRVRRFEIVDFLLLEDVYTSVRDGLMSSEPPVRDVVRDDPLSKREFNQDQRLLLLADEFDDKTLAVADFLREHEIDVICVVHQTFQSKEGPHLLTTESVRRPIHMEPTGTETEPRSGEPTTDSGKQRKAFWEQVNKNIGERASSLLNNGWQPGNYTSQNIAFSRDQVPLQAACKSRDEVVEMRLIIRDDRPLYERLVGQREAVETALEGSFKGDSDFEIDWVSPDETSASRARGKII